MDSAPRRLQKEIVAALEAAGRRQRWWERPDDGIVAACSGGGDSVAMLCLLQECWGGRIVVAHLQHGLRGERALADADFVAEHCRRAGLPYRVWHVDTRASKLPGESAEMAGRRLRYQFFGEIARDGGFRWIATGHTADDAAETQLLNLFRGSGVEGLSGIAEARGRIVRPLIAMRRADLRAWLAWRGVSWREDETNAENDYRRNKVRNILLPWVRENLNPAADDALSGLAGEARETSRAQHAEARALCAMLRRTDTLALAAWDTRVARALTPLRLAQALREQGRALGLPVLARARAQELLRLLRDSDRWRFQWAADLEVCGAARRVGWLRRDALTAAASVRAEIAREKPLRIAWGAWEIEVAFSAADEGPPQRGVWQARFAAGAGRADLIVSATPDCVKRIPWWERPLYPCLTIVSGGCERGWVPGCFSGFVTFSGNEAQNTVQDKGTCVIIARVFRGRSYRREGKTSWAAENI